MISKSYIDVDILAPLAVYIPGFIQIEWHVSEELEDRRAYVHCDHYNKIIIIKPAQEKVNRWIVWGAIISPHCWSRSVTADLFFMNDLCALNRAGEPVGVRDDHAGHH